MKKVIIVAVLFATFLSGIVISCKKTEIPPTNQDVSVSNSTTLKFDDEYHISSYRNILVFESSESYHSTVSNLDSTYNSIFFKKISEMNYTSSKDATVQKKEVDLIGDDYLASILNQDWIVQIGDYLYRVNIPNEKVFVLPVKHIDQYDQLVEENLKNSNIMAFSTDDDVIELVENGMTGQEKSLFCHDRKARRGYAISDIATITPAVTMRMQSKYYKGGIIFSLKSKGAYSTNLSYSLKFYFQLENCYFKQRCGYSAGPYSHPWRTSTSAWSGSQIKEIFKWYQGSKQLKEYSYKVRFRCENWLQPAGNNPYSVIFTTWVNISDY